MNASMHFVPRDLTVLKAFAFKVRVFGQRQLAESFWSGDLANARRRLRRFASVGLVAKSSLMVRPLPDMLSPVCTWKPGYPKPDCSAVSFQLQSRWRFRALRSTVVYRATPLLIDHLGGQQKSMVSTQVSHDLGVAAVWLWFHRHQPRSASAWVGEDMIEDVPSHQSQPDAVLVDEQSEPAMLIEFGGDYSAERISTFHEDAVLRGLPYQIW